MTQKEALQIVAKAREQLARIYGQRLRGVYLFGSWARGEADENSDVDVAVVLDHVASPLAEIEKTGDLFSDLGLEYGVCVSRVFIPVSDFQVGRYALYRAIQREGLPA